MPMGRFLDGFLVSSAAVATCVGSGQCSMGAGVLQEKGTTHDSIVTFMSMADVGCLPPCSSESYQQRLFSRSTHDMTWLGRPPPLSPCGPFTFPPSTSHTATYRVKPDAAHEHHGSSSEGATDAEGEEGIVVLRVHMREPCRQVHQVRSQLHTQVSVGSASITALHAAYM
jgi:hypothetical protein